MKLASQRALSPLEELFFEVNQCQHWLSVVTGPPGCGKSYLPSRMGCATHYRSGLSASNAPPGSAATTTIATFSFNLLSDCLAIAGLDPSALPARVLRLAHDFERIWSRVKRASNVFAKTDASENDVLMCVNVILEETSDVLRWLGNSRRNDREDDGDDDASDSGAGRGDSPENRMYGSRKHVEVANLLLEALEVLGARASQTWMGEKSPVRLRIVVPLPDTVDPSNVVRKLFGVDGDFSLIKVQPAPLDKFSRERLFAQLLPKEVGAECVLQASVATAGFSPADVESLTQVARLRAIANDTPNLAGHLVAAAKACAVEPASCRGAMDNYIPRRVLEHSDQALIGLREEQALINAHAALEVDTDESQSFSVERSRLQPSWNSNRRN